MNTQVITQIASFLQVSPNQIKRCEEWVHVLFVQVQGFRPRFVSKKVVKVQPKTFSGKWYPGMPNFDDPMDEMEWLDNYEAANGLSAELDVDGAICEIAKFLPMGSNPSEVNLLTKAQMVAEGLMTAQEAANQLSNKKIIIKK